MRAIYVFLAIFITVVVAISGFILLYMATFYPIKYKAEILSACEATNLPPNLVASVINAESRFDTSAVSRVGAMGLMQLMPATASEIAHKLGIDDFLPNDLFIPQINITLGTHYLRQLLEEFNEIDTALCAYNAGPSKVRGWLKDTMYSTDGKTLLSTPYLETNTYLAKIKRYQKIYQNYF